TSRFLALDPSTPSCHLGLRRAAGVTRGAQDRLSPQGLPQSGERRGRGNAEEQQGAHWPYCSTLASEGGTFREVLDAALSSPSGRGVIVDGTDNLAGTVTASNVLTRIEPTRCTHPRGRDPERAPQGDGTPTATGGRPVSR